MKTLLLSVFAITVCMTAFSQEEPSKKMPPLKMLPGPGEVKNIYELPDSADYEIFNQQGDKIESGKAEFIDYTHYKAGKYFICYNGKTEWFEKREE